MEVQVDTELAPDLKKKNRIGPLPKFFRPWGTDLHLLNPLHISVINERNWNIGSLGAHFIKYYFGVGKVD